MTRRAILEKLPLLLLASLLVPTVSLAQNTGIGGTVRDTAGAVVPGVTVEASSPALIEGVRTVVTGEQGLYQIIDLRPGVYTVTFTLTGFQTVKIEGIELSGSFTANVNAELPLGTLQETITVSGQTLAVDIRNVVQQKVLNDEVREALPTGRSILSMSELLPGINVSGGGKPSAHDIAGTSDIRGAMMIHGSRAGDYLMQFDGTPITLAGTGSQQTWQVNPGEIQEYVYELAGISAETQAGGVRSNIIPKEGGNRFAGSLFAGYSNHRLQSDNLTPALIATGLTRANRLVTHWDVNAAQGGPLKRDKIWFFGSYRNWGQQEEVTGMFHAIDPSSFVFNPLLGAAGNVDLNRPAAFEPKNKAYSGRVTWQATPRNKLALYAAHQPRRQLGLFMSGTRSFEASTDQNITTNRLIQGVWKAPVSSRLLLEANWADSYMPGPQTGTRPGLTDSDIVGVIDSGTGYSYRSVAAGTPYHVPYWYQPSAKAAASYVTGTHAAKFGMDYQWGHEWYTNVRHNQHQSFTFRNGVPIQLTVYNEPYTRKAEFNKLGLFAQDQWTVKRLTVNGGLRFDFQRGRIPEDQTSGPGRYAPLQTWPAVENAPNWKDVSPRLGVAYDLFGNGKTALKGTLNRYVVSEGVAFSLSLDPITFNQSATRAWTDANRDFIPQESELGPLSNANFATGATTSSTDDAIRAGWGVRPYNWETSAGIQHQLLAPLAVSVTYVRRSYANFSVTDNLDVGPSDFDEFCITAPSDARLGSVSGSQICGLYDLNPAKRGLVHNFRTRASNFGEQTEVFNGVDMLVNARFTSRATLSGGVSSGTSSSQGGAVSNSGNSCFIVDSPGAMRFCDVKRPWKSGVRLIGTLGLPWDLDAGITLQSNPGPEIQANYSVASAQVGSIVRFVDPARTSFTSGTATVPLLAPGAMFGERMNQLDIRLAKSIRYRGTRTRLMLDMANVLNSSDVLVLNNAYGSSWLRPAFLLPGRLFKLAGQFDF
jgi:hypothetical protein